MATREELIEQTIKKMQTKHPEQDVDLHREMLRKIFIEGIPAGEAMKLSKEFLEFVYAHAGNMFNAGKYEDAAQIYRFLRIYSPSDNRFAMALAACLHRQKKYKEAVDMYMLTYLLDKESFVPLYHMSDCFIQMNQPGAASIILQNVLKLIEGRDDLKIIRERVLLTVESLKPQFSPSKENKG